MLTITSGSKNFEEFRPTSDGNHLSDVSYYDTCTPYLDLKPFDGGLEGTVLDHLSLSLKTVRLKSTPNLNYTYFVNRVTDRFFVLVKKFINFYCYDIKRLKYKGNKILRNKTLTKGIKYLVSVIYNDTYLYGYFHKPKLLFILIFYSHGTFCLCPNKYGNRPLTVQDGSTDGTHYNLLDTSSLTDF